MNLQRGNQRNKSQDSSFRQKPREKIAKEEFMCGKDDVKGQALKKSPFDS